MEPLESPGNHTVRLAPASGEARRSREPLVRLLHRRIRVRFLFGGEAVGQLMELAKYELVLGVAPGQSIVVFKGAVQTVEEIAS